MIACTCTFQEGQISEQLFSALSTGLEEITQTFFKDTVSIRWIPITKGSGYTGGKPSTSSLVSMNVPNGTITPTRNAVLTAICDLWTQQTGCELNEIVASAFDIPSPNIKR